MANCKETEHQQSEVGKQMATALGFSKSAQFLDILTLGLVV